jgi:CelD/BcsL family acetyltransferase involved in cellulose biosynthesis
VFSNREKRDFYKKMANSFLYQGWLRFYSLRLNGRYVAHQFCTELNRRVYLHQEGFDPDLSNQRIGNALRAYVFRDCIRRGVLVYDFLAGVTSHKLSWGSAVKQSFCLCVARRTARNLPYLLIPRAIESARKLKNWGEQQLLGRIFQKE